MSFLILVERSGPYRFVLQGFGLGPYGKLVHSRKESDRGWEGWVPFLRSRPFRFLEAKYGATGHLELFGIGDDDVLYHNWQNSDDENWHEWGALFADAPKLQSVTAALGNSGNLEIFGIGLDGTLYHAWQDKDRWYTWGRDFQGAPRVSSVVAVIGATGHLEVFAVGADDGTLYHNWIDGDGVWQHWAPDFQGAPKVKLVAAAVGSGPNLHVFAIARDDDAIAHLRQDGNQWYSWERDFLGGPRVRFITVVDSPRAQLEVFAIGTDHALLRTWQDSPGGPYDGWHPWERNFQGAPPHAEFVTGVTGGGTAGTEGPHLEVFLIATRP